MGQYNHQPSSLVRGHVQCTKNTCCHYQLNHYHSMQVDLTGPPHTGASPRPSPLSAPLCSLPVLHCKLRQQSMGQWGQELPLRITAITHYLWNQPLTPILQVNSILQNLTPTLPARTTSCHTTRGSMWPPLNASGEGSPQTVN